MTSKSGLSIAPSRYSERALLLNLRNKGEDPLVIHTKQLQANTNQQLFHVQFFLAFQEQDKPQTFKRFRKTIFIEKTNPQNDLAPL